MANKPSNVPYIELNGEYWIFCGVAPGMVWVHNQDTRTDRYVIHECLLCKGNTVRNFNCATCDVEWKRTVNGDYVCNSCDRIFTDVGCWRFAFVMVGCEHCNGSGVGLDWGTLKDVPNGCTRCGGSGKKTI